MALKLNTEKHIFHYKSLHIDKSQPLGRGSYGAVYKAKCDQLACAAKVLHPTILDPKDPGADKILARFYHECTFLGGICHPYIVQYLGISRDPESRLPVLLMELLDESLTQMLCRSQQPLAYCVQVDICHDIALAIAYLHSNDIIHRDLSSNNVLVIAGRRAKVTDFGMSKLACAVAPNTASSLTACPGTLAYMPPEALREPPWYTKKLDCFSEGVLMIQVCTQLWPEPGPRTYTIPDPRSPTGTTEMPVLDTQRRKNHIELIDPSHPFLPLIEKCLTYIEDKRPTASELCQKLEDLKKKKEYYDSAGGEEESYSDLKRRIQELQISEETKDKRIQELEKELAKARHDIKRQSENIMRFRQAIQQMKDTMKEREKKVHEKREEMASKEKQIKQLTEQLNQQQAITAEFQQSNEHLLRQLDRMKKKPLHSLEDDQQQSHSPLRSSTERKLSLSWRGEEEAPEPLLRGTAVVDGDIVYFMHQYLGKVYSYNSTTNRWVKLLYCPHKESSLAVVRGQLTTIGGRKFELLTSSERILNELLSLCVTSRGEEWVERFPPMPTKRYGVTTVIAANFLIVAGGITTHGDSKPRRLLCTDAVEVLSISNLTWSQAASLPHPYTRASAAINGDQLFLLGGGHNKGEMSLLAMVCSLTELLQSCDMSKSRSHDPKSQSCDSKKTVWWRITDTPLYDSTCVAVRDGGGILTIGGQDVNGKSSADIYKYNPTRKSWDAINSHMPSARNSCLVAVLPKKVVVVGGDSHLCDTKTTNIVEVADL